MASERWRPAEALDDRNRGENVRVIIKTRETQNSEVVGGMESEPMPFSSVPWSVALDNELQQMTNAILTSVDSAFRALILSA